MKTEKLLRNIEIKKYFILLVLVIFFILFIIKTQKILIFLVLTLISGIICFVNYRTGLPFDFSPVFFLSIIITSTYGFGYTFLFVILSGFIPSILFGKGPDFNSFMCLSLNLLMNLLWIGFSGFNIISGGVIFSIIYSVLAASASIFVEGNVGKEVVSMVITILVNVFYFLKLGTVLITILG